MVSADREPITGAWGLFPQWGQRAKPMVRVSGAKPLEAERIFIING